MKGDVRKGSWLKEKRKGNIALREMGEKEQREGEGREPTSPNQVRVNILLLDIHK